MAKRDNLHFFKYNDYNKDLETLSRECMRKLPAQFLRYMQNNKIVPYITSKDLQAASQEYMQRKCDEKNNKKKRKAQTKEDDEEWLQELRKQFLTRLYELGYNKETVNKIVYEWGLFMPDVNHFIEMLNKNRELDQNLREFSQPKDLTKYTSKINPRLEIPDPVKRDVLPLKQRNPRLG